MSNVFLNNCDWSFITSRFWTHHTGKGRNDDHHSDSKQQPPPMNSMLVILFGYPQFYLSLESLDCPLPWNHWFEIGRSRYHGWTVSTRNAMLRSCLVTLKLTSLWIFLCIGVTDVKLDVRDFMDGQFDLERFGILFIPGEDKGPVHVNCEQQWLSSWL